MVRQKQAEIFLVIATLFWGATFLITKISLSMASPLFLQAMRFILAAIFFTLLNFKKLKGKWDRKLILAGLLMGFLMFLGFGAQTLGLKYTTVSKSSFITYSFAPLVPPLQYLLLKQKVNKANLLGLFFVVIGLYLLTNPEGGEFNLGDSITLFCAVGFSLYLVLINKFSPHYNVYKLILIQFIVTAVLTMGLSLYFDGLFWTVEPGFWFSVLYLALFGSVVSIVLMNKYQKYVTPLKATLIYALEPVFSFVLAITIYHEVINLSLMTGIVFILAGVFLSEALTLLSDKRKAAAK